MPVTLTFMAATATWAFATDFGAVVLAAEVIEVAVDVVAIRTVQRL